MSVLKLKVNSSSNFALFFIVMTHNSTVNLKLIHFQFWTKGSYQSSNFKTFDCSGENLQNSCHFPSIKSVFLQILDHSSMSWKTTSLYFFSSNNIYFPQKEPIKIKIFETFECSGHILSNSLCQFWNNESIPLQILYSSAVSWKITSLTFLAQRTYTLLKRSPLKWKVWRLRSAQVKICQIFYVNFETTRGFLSKFCIPLQFHKRLFLCSFLAQTIYSFLKKSPLKLKSLRLSSARIIFYQIRYANFEMTSQFLSKFCIPPHFHERFLLYTFLAQTIYTLLIRSPFKWKSFRDSNAQVKICQIHYGNFETTSRFLSKFCIPLQFHER